MIVLSIAFSSAIIFWESFNRLLDPQPLRQVGWVAAAALIGLTILFITRDAALRVWLRLMDGIEPSYVDRIEQLAGEVPGVVHVHAVRARWIGHALDVVVKIRVAEGLLHVESHVIGTRVQTQVRGNLAVAAQVTVSVVTPPDEAYDPFRAEATAIFPPRYRSGAAVSAAPMGAAALQYDADGQVAWDQIWTGFCELALAGGAPHCGLLLEPVDPQAIVGREDDYQRVLAELERGIRLVTGRVPARWA